MSTLQMKCIQTIKMYTSDEHERWAHMCFYIYVYRNGEHEWMMNTHTSIEQQTYKR